MNINQIRDLVRAKYKRHWEWRSTTRTGGGRSYMMQVWTGLDRADKAGTVTIYANLSRERWTAHICHMDKSGPQSQPNEVREQAVEEALKLWWTTKKQEPDGRA